MAQRTRPADAVGRLAKMHAHESITVEDAAHLIGRTPDYVRALVANCLLGVDDNGMVESASVMRYCRQGGDPYKTRGLEVGLRLPEPEIGAWRSLFDKCWMCGRKVYLEIHHIERRSQAARRGEYDIEENWFLACERCHSMSLATMAHREQLAYKWRFDKCGWETLDEFLERWLRIRDPHMRAPERVTDEDILSSYVELFDWEHEPGWYRE